MVEKWVKIEQEERVIIAAIVVLICMIAATILSFTLTSLYALIPMIMPVLIILFGKQLGLKD